MSKAKKYSQADLILLYDLKRFVGNETSPFLSEWLDPENQIELNSGEQYIFNLIFADAQEKIEYWYKEELKIKFIAFVLKLGHLVDDPPYNIYFKRTIKATVDTHFLKVKTDCMIAQGLFDQPLHPYFHFQVWKKYCNPVGDPIAQLLTAFLISQENNQTQEPMYGCTVTGKFWRFMVMVGKEYFISRPYDCTKEEDLLMIISILRRFKYYLDALKLNVIPQNLII
ncbi:MAG: hypothetical protein KAH08_03570 [Methylococcales bacterium]|nr:hypothetical protein [Methylococcales bacterium]